MKGKLQEQLFKYHHFILAAFFIVVFITNIKGDYDQLMRIDDIRYRAIVKLAVRLLFLPTGIFLLLKNKIGWILVVFILMFQFSWSIFHLLDWGFRKELINLILSDFLIVILYIFLNSKKVLTHYMITNRQRLIVNILLVIIAISVVYPAYYNLPNIFYKNHGGEQMILLNPS